MLEGCLKTLHQGMMSPVVASQSLPADVAPPAAGLREVVLAQPLQQAESTPRVSYRCWRR